MLLRRFLARALVATLAAALVTPLAACGGGGDDGPTAATSIESTTFASSLGVDLGKSTRTATGLYYRDLGDGAGTPVANGQRVAVRYTGWLANGTQFGSNVGGATLEFTLGSGQLIPGLEQGIVGMRVGGRRQLVIPPSLAYGSSGQGTIPGNAILVVNVELVDPVAIETATFAPTLGVDLTKSTKTANGVYVRDLTVGTGTAAAVGSVVSLRYTGRLASGAQFDSNVDSGSLLQFTVGLQQVIPGFEQGVVGMQVGGKRQIIIPPVLGYGTQANGPIPANSILVFEVELVSLR
jgi:peptidylprolyl isomerase